MSSYLDYRYGERIPVYVRQSALRYGLAAPVRRSKLALDPI